MEWAEIFEGVRPAAADVLDLPAELGVLVAELVAPHPRSAGVLSPNGRVGFGQRSAVLPHTIDLFLR